MQKIVSPEVAAAVLKQKAVKDHLANKYKDETLARRTDPLRLVGSLGLGAAGYGMKRLGDAAISPEDRSTVENLIALKAKLGPPVPLGPGPHGIAERLLPAVQKNPDYDNSRDLFYDYIDRASKASKVKVYGEDVIPLMHKVKKHLGLDPELDESKLSPLDKENIKHYPAFQEGPLPAYDHQIRKVTLDPAWKEWLFKKDGKDVYPDQQKFQTGIDKHMADYLQETHGTTNIADVASKLNHGQQMEAVRGFDGWLGAKDPELANAKQVAENHLSEAQHWASNAYSSGAGKALNILQDIPRDIGYGAMGLGALGAGWYGLNKFKKWRKDKADAEATAKTASVIVELMKAQELEKEASLGSAIGKGLKAINPFKTSSKPAPIPSFGGEPAKPVTTPKPVAQPIAQAPTPVQQQTEQPQRLSQQSRRNVMGGIAYQPQQPVVTDNSFDAVRAADVLTRNVPVVPNTPSNPNVIQTPLGDIDKRNMPDAISRLMPDEIGVQGASWKLPDSNTSFNAEPMKSGLGASLAFNTKF